MYKRLLFSAVVISLGLATGIAQGTWCMDGRICTPEEEVDLCQIWGPPPVVIEGDVELPCEWPCMKICCDIDISGQFNGPGGDCDQTLRIYCGTVNIGNQWWVANTGSGVGTLILEGTAVVNSLSGSSRSFRCGDRGGNPRVIVRENATLNISGGWRNGDAAGGWICLHFSGDCYVYAWEYIRIGDDGAGEMHFDGGTVVCDGSIYQNGRGGIDMGDMTIANDVEIWCGQDFTIISQKVNAACHMSGGAVNCRNFNVHAGGDSGNAALNMTGGLIIARGSFNCPRNGGGAVAHTQLDGGEIRCDDLSLPEGGTIDITGGKIVIDGDKLDQIWDLVCAHGRITGYGSCAAVAFTYDAETDKTIVTAQWRDPLEPYCAKPTPGSLARCGSGVCLGWAGTHGIRDRHTVYFSEDRECVENMDPECMLGYVPASRPPLYCVPPEHLTLWTTYYWRIVEVYYGGPTIPGPVWSFTCGCPLLSGDLNRDCVVNFEDYAEMATTWQQEDMWP
ncbi:MAG: hypothetical protein ACYTEQ_20145 [Planctomycetota bacterium]|jgi:hypothetical protein